MQGNFIIDKILWESARKTHYFSGGMKGGEQTLEWLERMCYNWSCWFIKAINFVCIRTENSKMHFLYSSDMPDLSTTIFCKYAEIITKSMVKGCITMKRQNYSPHSSKILITGGWKRPGAKCCSRNWWTWMRLTRISLKDEPDIPDLRAGETNRRFATHSILK